MAEGVFRNLLAERGLTAEVETDSAGTGDWHLGARPDARACAAAAARGVDISDLRARQITRADFAVFDYILAMDAGNYADLRAMAGAAARDKVHLFSRFAPGLEGDVADPYFGGEEDFHSALDAIVRGCDGLLAHLLAGQK